MTQAQIAAARQNRTFDQVPDCGIGSVGWIANGWDARNRPNPMTRVRITKMPAPGSYSRIARVWDEARGIEMPCTLIAIWEHPRD